MKLIQRVVLALVAVFGLASCGGGGGDFGIAGGTLKISITADGTNILSAGEAGAPSGQMSTFYIEITDEVGRLFPAEEVSVDLAPGLTHGALYYLDGDPAHENDDGTPTAYRRLIFSGTTGLISGHFIASSIPGTATLTVSMIEPASGKPISKELRINVVQRPELPIASLEFTGPYVQAILAGESEFGNEDGVLLDGSYSRVLSVIAKDHAGQPAWGSRVEFFLIDYPITGYPGAGAGSFLNAGPDGDPVEGGFRFDAASGNFLNGGIRRFDQLVIDGMRTAFSTTPAQPGNRLQTGIREIQTVISNTALLIDQAGAPFVQAENHGDTVPYVAGRAQYSSVLSVGYADQRGVASTLLTYPDWRLGATAILVACTPDREVCTTLNTCDNNGANCDSVFLGVADHRNGVLKASESKLRPNSENLLEICAEDSLRAPYPAAPIDFSVVGGGASVIVEVLEADGSVSASFTNGGTFLTGANGCRMLRVTTEGQIAGSDPMELIFTSFAVNPAEPLVVQIPAPGAGTLIATVGDCEVPGTCEIELLLVDNNGIPIPGTPITGEVTATDGGEVCDSSGMPIIGGGLQQPDATINFDPADGRTRDDGTLTATVITVGDEGDVISATFTALGGATVTVILKSLDEIFACEEAAP